MTTNKCNVYVIYWNRMNEYVCENGGLNDVDESYFFFIHMNMYLWCLFCVFHFFFIFEKYL